MNIAKLLIPALLLCTATSQAATPVPFAIYDNDGRQVDFDAMAADLAKNDVVFVGENHNCPFSHWFELKIAEALYKAHGDRLVIGEEMLEADNQTILDEYMSRRISADRFEREARLWDNYSTDYYPVVFFAKENKIPFVATNIPRRYAAATREGGFDALKAFSDEARTYMAPLPIPFEYDAEKSGAAFGFMMLMRGGQPDPEDSRRLAEAQAMKDATMAWFIAKNMKDGTRFLHINGSMHSDNRDGIIPYLAKYRPGTKVATVTSVRQENASVFDPDNRGRADYYIVVDESFPTSY